MTSRDTLSGIEIGWGSLCIIGFILTVCVLYPIYKWWQFHTHSKKITHEAALELQKDIQKALECIADYKEQIVKLSEAYKASDDEVSIPRLLPKIRLSLEAIKLGSDFRKNYIKMGDRARQYCFWTKIFDENKYLHHLSAYYIGQMMHAMVDLLGTANMPGFTRSMKLLEQYINRKSSTSHFIVETFVEDYYEETIHGAINSYGKQMKIFSESELLFNSFVDDVEYIIRKNSKAL